MSAIAVLSVLVVHAIPGAATDRPDIEGGADKDVFTVVGNQSQSGTESVDSSPGQSSNPQSAPYVQYQWVSACASSPTTPTQDLDCARAFSCAQQTERRWYLWGRLPDGQWIVLSSRCAVDEPEAAQPQVTPGLVLEALRRVGLPPLTVQTQPKTKTLVNLDTIFYADPSEVRRTLTILGQSVEVVATPSAYHWDFGDGTRLSTREPGAPYPSKEITHRYLNAHVTVRPQVAVEYAARFRVAGGPWQEIGETVAITGPAGELRVAEATAVLSGQHG